MALVRKRGLEPPRESISHYPLKVARLPIPPLALLLLLKQAPAKMSRGCYQLEPSVSQRL